MTSGERNLAWHCVGATLRDGQPIPADEVWLEHKGDMKMCETVLNRRMDLIARMCDPYYLLCSLHTHFV